MKGLICGVYVDKSMRGSDCSLGGVSAKYNAVTLVGPGVDGPFEPDATAPAVVLREIRYRDKVFVHAVPLELAQRQTSFGGCFIYTSDGRFPSGQPIALHDRLEPPIRPYGE